MLKRIIRDESGQGLTEYALLGAIVAVAVIGGLVALRGQLPTGFSHIRTGLTSS